jgi:hypothetical protein
MIKISLKMQVLEMTGEEAIFSFIHSVINKLLYGSIKKSLGDSRKGISNV